MIDNLPLTLLAALAGTGFLYALHRNLQESRRRAARRGAFLDDVQTLISGGLKKANPDGYPRISGEYGGLTFDVQAVPDTLNMRKLPALWLLVSLPEPLPVRATFDLMMRPRGVEMFSRHSQLPIQMAPVEAFPHDCAVRTDDPAQLPPQALLLRHLHVFDDARAKELIISPRGLRIVWLAEQANRGRYLLFRDSEMGASPFPAAEMKPLLDYLIGLRADITATMQETAP